MLYLWLEFTGWGNNPAPIKLKASVVMSVIMIMYPTRLVQMFAKKKS